MAFLTDRKRVEGLGASGRGTDHHWSQMLSSAALLILIPSFIFTFGTALGRSYDDVLAYYANPLPAAIAGLTLLVGMHHFRLGATVMIEDYVHGVTRKLLIVGVTLLAYGLAALGIAAVAMMAL